MELIFWNVDTQKDFMNPDGSLYVPGAEEIKPALKKLTEIARKYRIQTVNTADWHNKDSEELSNEPDFVNTFPPHCIAGSEGAEFVDETNPDLASIVNWDLDPRKDEYFLGNGGPVLNTYTDILCQKTNVIIRKDKFDVFTGNQYTDLVLNTINPGMVVVYGVATNVCVDFAVKGLLERGKEVYVVSDAIKELPNIPNPEKAWYEAGAKKTTVNELEELIKSYR